MKRFVVAVLMLVMVGGCATFNKVVTNESLVMQLAVESATARVLHEHPMWTGQTITITAAAIAGIDSKAVISLGNVESFVRAHISWSKLLPEEQALLSVLISNVKMNLEDSFRSKGIKDVSAQMITVKEVLQWINQTARRNP